MPKAEAGEQSIAYLFDQGEEISGVAYRVIQKNSGNGWLKCIKIKFNGQIKLIYPISGYLPMEAVCENWGSEKTAEVMLELLDIFKTIENSGFLSLDMIDMDISRLFYEAEKKQAGVCILPYAFERKKGTGVEWYFKLRKLFSLMMELSAEPDCGLFGKIRAILAGEHLMIENLYREIETAVKETETDEAVLISGGSTEKIAAGRKKSVKGNLHFISRNPIYKTDIRIDKNGFVFGKYRGHVDGLLTMSPAISRRHCKVSFEGGVYYIEDLGSMNHTYVNQRRLVPGERTKLVPGDIVQLADIEFEIADEG